MGTLNYKFPVHNFTRQAVIRLGLKLVKRELEKGDIALPAEAVSETERMLVQLSKLIRKRKRDLSPAMRELAALSE